LILPGGLRGSDPTTSIAAAVVSNAFSDEVEAALVQVLRQSVGPYLTQDD